MMLNKIMCKLFGAAFYINFGITTFSIAGIAINRYKNYLFRLKFSEFKKVFQIHSDRSS